jgi:hypothetical protein
MLGKRTAILTTVPALLALPALALAVASGRPAAGNWKLAGGGGFTVNASQSAISGFHIRSACGLKKLTVPGSLTLHESTAGGVTNWLVGFGDPTRKSPHDISGVVPQRVTFRAGSKSVSGRLDLIFAVGGYARDNDGDIVIGSCTASFYASK